MSPACLPPLPRRPPRHPLHLPPPHRLPTTTSSNKTLRMHLPRHSFTEPSPQQEQRPTPTIPARTPRHLLSRISPGRSYNRTTITRTHRPPLQQRPCRNSTTPKTLCWARTHTCWTSSLRRQPGSWPHHLLLRQPTTPTSCSIWRR